MTPFYTGKGDEGDTGLLGDQRVPKYDLRIEALGAIDETVAALGIARAIVGDPTARELLLNIQRELYGLMAEVAATPENAAKFSRINSASIHRIEVTISRLTETVTIPDQFIVPGDTLPAAVVDLARTVARRAERRIVELFDQHQIENPALVSYMNRLSSLLFVLELDILRKDAKSQPTLMKVKKES